MIITLKGADFSANNIGTLSSWTVSRVLGTGATYSGVSSVDKGASLSATVTIADGYELGSAGVTVTMGGVTQSSAYSISGSTITISIASVTGNVVIKVPTKNTSTGSEDNGSDSSIVLELTKSAYWWNMASNPAGNTNMVTTAYTSMTNQKYFWCTQKFTKDTLPNGSVITLASGWQYRAEWWNANNDPVPSQSERGLVVSTAGSVTVDDAWWNGMTTRAFNIYIDTSTDISGYTADQINAAFKITKGA